MRRDSIYYQIFKRFPELIFTLVPNPPAQAQNYRFESVEVKEPTFRIDGVFIPPEGLTPKTVYFAEVQFQKDDGLYHSFFSESMLYLYRNQSLYEDWYGVVIFTSRNLEPSKIHLHRSLLNGEQVQRIYLDELGDLNEQPIGINLMQLTIASEKEMVDLAKQVIERVQQSESSTLASAEIIEIITTIAVYKFSSLSREEVEAMLGLTLEETRFYQQAKQEGREERETEMLRVTVPLLLRSGMSVEQIAQVLNVDVESVQQAIQ